MDDAKKISLLNEELDEESATYLKESINAWKEEMMAKLQEEVEQAKNDKIEELEEANIAYREELKEEYSDKLIAAINDLRESVKAEVTAEVIKNNPELKILEQVKELVAPLLNEDFREDAYSDTITQLSEENEALRREQEITEGAQTLAELLSPYSEKTQKLVLSLIKEGSPEEVTEQFYTIMESLQEVFAEEDDDEEEEEDDKNSKSDEEDDDEEEDDESDDDDDEDVKNESYIYEGFEGDDDDDYISARAGSLKDIMTRYTK